MEAFIKVAILQTVVDAIEVLWSLRATATAAQQQKIDEMIQRLTTMVSTLK